MDHAPMAVQWLFGDHAKWLHSAMKDIDMEKDCITDQNELDFVFFMNPPGDAVHGYNLKSVFFLAAISAAT